MRRASRTIAEAAALALAWAGVAAAEPTSPRRTLYVERSTCDATPSAAVASVLRVELHNRLVEEAPSEDSYRVAIECAGEAVTVSVSVPSGPAMSFRTSLARAPANVRPRIVALAVAELVRDLDRESLEPPPPPPPPPIVPPQPQRVREEPPHETSPRRVLLAAFAQSSSFDLSGTWLTGGGLRFQYALGRFGVGLDAAAQGTTQRFDLGSAQVVVAYGSPFVAWLEAWGRLHTRVGAGYAVGAASVSGRPGVPRAYAATATGPWSAPYASVGLGVTLVGGVSVDAGGLLGWVTSPVVGQVTGAGGVTIEGAWASVELGLTIAL